MTEQENNITIWSDKILQTLLEYRTKEPNLKFWLRQRNKGNRLDEGYWFNGNEDYIHVGFSKLGAGNLSTQSIGFVLAFGNSEQIKSKIEITYRGEKNEKVIACYKGIIAELDGFIKMNDTQYYKLYDSSNPLNNLEEFLTVQKPQLDKIINDFGLKENFEISDDDFERSLTKILKKRDNIKSKLNINFIIANITWNSNDWKEVSQDISGHAWVGGENIPSESWNFDFNNPRNSEDKIKGYAKFTNPPKVDGENNLIIFYSQGKIVGFYGKAEVLQETININEQESYNLIGDRNLSLVLNNKIDDIKEKGFLEDKLRVGQIGFSYLQKTETAFSILEEAISLNPEQSEVINNIIDWLENQDDNTSDEERLISRLKEIGFSDSQKFYTIMEDILKGLSVLEGDDRFCYSLPKTNLIGLTIGQKYCAILERKQRKNTYRYFNTLHNAKQWLKEANSIEDMAKQLNTIIQSADLELSKTVKTGYSNHSSDSLEKSLFDKEYKTYVFKKAFNTEVIVDKEIITDNMSTNLNQILFGPPGTGKTYNTINKAIKIADPDFYELNKNNRKELKERFKLLLLNSSENDNGQIGFTTFHQSFSYEDFVEGIKPVEPKEEDTFLKYKIEEGIFKKICRLATDSLKSVNLETKSLISLTDNEYENAHFYKMSLGNSQEVADQVIFDYCVENNCISIGFGNGHDFSGKDEKELKTFGSEKNLDSFSIQAMNLFKNYMKEGNYVVISNGNNYVRAIGKLTGDYEYIEESPFPNNPTFNHFRTVDWIFNDTEIAAKDIYHKNLSQQTIYKLDKKEIKREFFVKEKKVDTLKLPKNPKNFVLIIDEINRGNVSSIFGELITLIEKDKRAGGTEELSVILPYSKKEFKVPHNVFIIGTMNTADRSIEALDTALRRRFSFTEMAPKSYLISDESKLKESNGKIGAIDVVKILDTVNNRIEKLIDKDHKIGHSYFMDIVAESDLKRAFKDKVIPLLEEYFFGDFGKIGLVLGNSFITKTGKDSIEFAEFTEYDSSIRNDLMERSVFKITNEDDWNFESIYKKSN
jgi:hypothetical protein